MLSRGAFKLLSHPILVIVVSSISVALVVVVLINAWSATDPHLANQQSLVGTWRCGAVVRQGGAADSDPFHLDTLRSITIASDDRSVAEVTITLKREDGMTFTGIGCTDKLPGFVRLNLPATSRMLTVSTSADGVVSIDDGNRAFVLERQ